MVALINSGLWGMASAVAQFFLPLMAVVFAGGVLLRVLIYLTVKAEAVFAAEFDKRVHKRMNDPNYEPNGGSFQDLVHRLLQRTFDEHYKLRKEEGRRKHDGAASSLDKLLMVSQGTSRLISDTLTQIKQLSKEGEAPRFIEVSKVIFEMNPVFNRVIGVFPLGRTNDLLNALPGMLVFAGCLGTFLSLMHLLPQIGSTPGAGSIPAYLSTIAGTLGAASAGLLFAIAQTAVNAIFNPESRYFAMVNRYAAALEAVWNVSHTNEAHHEAAVPSDRRAVVFSNPRPPAPVPVVEGKESEPFEAAAEQPVEEAAAEATEPPPPPFVPPRHPEAPADVVASVREEFAADLEDLTPTGWVTAEAAPRADEAPAPAPEEAAPTTWVAAEVAPADEAPPAPEVPAEAQVARLEAEPDEAPVVFTAPPAPPFTDEAPAAAPVDEMSSLSDVFDKMDDAFSSLEDAPPDEVSPFTADSDEDRLAVLRHRLQVLDSYLMKADDDKATGLMSEEMWKDETEAYRQERAHVEAQIEAIKAKRAA